MKGRNEVYKHYSTVTTVEEVSYVASPFVLDCVKQDRDAEWTDNSTRAHEVARADHTLRDEVTEHVIMENVKLLISEWVPFGANQIVALNETLGSADRCKVIPTPSHFLGRISPIFSPFFPVFLRVFTVSTRRFQQAPSRNPGPRNSRQGNQEGRTPPFVRHPRCSG